MIMLLAIVILYGSIWFVPLAVNINRRKAGKKPYWLLFMLALVLEILSLLLSLGLFSVLDFEAWGIYLSPMIAAAVAGFFYWQLCERRDRS